MSSTQTPSGSSTPDSLHHSDRSHDSDTTPSPSGYRSPDFDPNILSSKLALYEASKSLSIVADTLTAAAQAISKAAASLAVAAGSNFATEKSYQKRRVFEDELVYEAMSPISGTFSPLWQQSSYVLSANSAAPQQSQAHNFGPANTEEPIQSICLPEDQTSVPDSGSRVDVTNREHKSADEPMSTTPILEINPAPVPSNVNDGGINLNPHTAPTNFTEGITLTNAPSTETSKKDEITTAVHQMVMPEPPNAPKIDVSKKPEPKPKAPAPKAPIKPTSATPVKASTPAAPPAPPPASSKKSPPANKASTSSIVLDHAFDEIPTVAYLCKQHTKTICFYKYWDAAQCFADTFKLLVSPSTTAATVTKESKQSALIASLVKGRTSILFWPSHVALPTSTKITPESNVQVIHIGEVSQPNSGITGARNIIVTTSQHISGQTKTYKSELLKEYPLDARNGEYNDQSSKSPIHAHRTQWRARFVKKSPAHALYAAFISYHRTHAHNLSPRELAKKANEYAQEYLLRGGSNGVGGRIPLKRSEVDKWKLQPAVQSGDLIVEA